MENRTLLSTFTVTNLADGGPGSLRQAIIETVAPGVGRRSLVVEDFNGDGRLDLAVANAGSNAVSILLGNGDGTFQPAAEYAVGQSPKGIVAGDFTGDGHLDLAVANAGSNDVSILLGNGDGTFQIQRTYPVGTKPWAIMTGDFTGDAIADLAVANAGSDDVSILLGNGDGTFPIQRTYVMGEPPTIVATGESLAGISGGVLNFSMSTAGREAALQQAFDLGGAAGSEGGVPPVVVTPGSVPSLAVVLSQAASGSVRQVAQLLSLSGSTLDLAATWLTVSVGPDHSEAALSASPTGLDQGLEQAQGHDRSGGSGDEPSEPAEGSEPGLPAAVAALPPWERLSIGWERAWDQARAAMRELEREPMAGAPWERTPGPAVGPRAEPPGPAPASSRTRAPSDSASRSDAAADPLAPAGPSADRRPEDTSRVLDAALEDLAAPGEADGPSVRRGLGWWHELARGGPAATASALIAVVASASAVDPAWTLGARRVQRRRPAARGLP
jgi:hypothetical protein